MNKVIKRLVEFFAVFLCVFGCIPFILGSFFLMRNKVYMAMENYSIFAYNFFLFIILIFYLIGIRYDGAFFRRTSTQRLLNIKPERSRIKLYWVFHIINAMAIIGFMQTTSLYGRSIFKGISFESELYKNIGGHHVLPYMAHIQVEDMHLSTFDNILRWVVLITGNLPMIIFLCIAFIIAWKEIKIRKEVQQTVKNKHCAHETDK